MKFRGSVVCLSMLNVVIRCMVPCRKSWEEKAARLGAACQVDTEASSLSEGSLRRASFVGLFAWSVG
jgi:hypothetical protein